MQPEAGSSRRRRITPTRKFTYESFERLLNETRTYVVDSGTLNDDPLQDEQRLERSWSYTYSVDGNLLTTNEVTTRPVLPVPTPTATPAGPQNYNFTINSNSFDQISNAYYTFDDLGRATNIRDISTSLASLTNQDDTFLGWRRTTTSGRTDRKWLYHDPMGRRIAEQTEVQQGGIIDPGGGGAAAPMGAAAPTVGAGGGGPTTTVTYRTLFQYAGWELAAEYDVPASGSTNPTVRWRYYSEGGMDRVTGGTRGSTPATAEDYVAVHDDLG